MKYPIAFVTIPILLGVIFCYYVKVHISAILLLLVLGIIICIAGLRLDYSMVAGLAVILFLMGIALTSFKLEGTQLIKYTDKPIEITGTVEKAVISEDKMRLIIRVRKIKQDDIYIDMDEKLLLNLIGHKDIRVGDRIRFNGILKEPLPNTNPHLFNYKLNLLSEGIFTTCTIREYMIEELVRNELDLFTRFKLKAKEEIEGILDLYLNEDNSLIMKSILLGDYRYLEEEEVGKFRDLGLAHVIAVSGLHIGIITVLLIYFLAYLGINRRVNIVISIAIIWTYAYIIDFPLSVLRANIMYTVLLLSQLLKKPYDSLNSLFLSLLLMVIINPFWIFHVGFQLSFVATFYVIYYTPKVSSIFSFKKEGMFKSLSSIVAAQLGVLPILAYYFNRLPTVGIVANLLLVPLFNICLVMTILLIPMSFVNGYLASSMGTVIDSIINVQSLSMNILSYFPVLYVKVRSPSIFEIILYYFIMFIVFEIIIYRNVNRRAFKLVVIFFVAILVTNQLLISLDNSLSIEFIDVGQGDSILIRSKRGNYLIDTGGDIFGQFDVGENVLLPYLEKQGIFKLDRIFISHFDKDHCGSLPYLMDNMKIEKIYISYTDDDNELYRDIKVKAIERGVSLRILKKGDLLKLSNDTHLLVISPDRDLLDMVKGKDNDLSLVLLLMHLDNKVLFTGDIERRGEMNVVETLHTNIDLLKVPHHGSNTSSSVELLQKLKPKAAVVSAGRNNMFGHPHGEVVKRYEENNISLYRTDESGLIRVCLYEDGFIVNTFLKEKKGLISLVEDYKLFISQVILCSIVLYVSIRYFIKADERMNQIGLERVYE